MSTDLIQGIVQGGAVMLLAIVLAILIPKAMRSMERQGKSAAHERNIDRKLHHRQMREYRDAHRDDVRQLSGAIIGMQKELREQTRELMKQTVLLDDMRANLSADLPPLPDYRQVTESTDDLVKREQREEMVSVDIVTEDDIEQGDK